MQLKHLRVFSGIVIILLLNLLVGGIVLNSMVVTVPGQAQSAPVCDPTAFEMAQARYLEAVRLRDAGAISAAEFEIAREAFAAQVEACAPAGDEPIYFHGRPDSLLYPEYLEEFVLRGTKWGANSPFTTPPRSAGGTVTYSFMPSGISFTNGIGETASAGNSVTLTSFPTYQSCFYDEIRNAFAAWQAVSNIQFVEVTDSGTAYNAAGALGNIRIAGHAIDNASNVLAHAFFPPPLGGPSFEGDLHFDIAENWQCTPGAGRIDIGIVTLHEIGHSIGLRHEPSILAVMNATYNAALTALLNDDKLGAQQIYGEVPGTTPIPTYTPTGTLSATPTRTPTFTPSNTSTFTPTPSNTPTSTFTPSNTPTSTPTPSNTPTFTPSPTATATQPPPPAVTLIAPLGSIGLNDPAFSWNAISGTAWYYLWISASDGTTFSQWYDGGLVCAGGTCSVDPNLTFGAGVQRWWVQSWTLEGSYGAWSAQGSFTSPTPPATPIAPTGIVTPNPALTYQWNAVPGVSWYQLWISAPDNSGFSQWYDASNCAGSLCSVTPNLVYMSGTYRWWVQTWNADSGYGAWSSETNFSIPLGTPTQIAPLNTTTGTQPTYSWQAQTGATWYYLWVSNTNGYVLDQWFQDSVCVGGVCSATPNVILTNGAHRWWIQAWSPATGYSSWSAQGNFTVAAPAPLDSGSEVTPPTAEATIESAG